MWSTAELGSAGSGLLSILHWADYPAVPASPALSQAGISPAAHRVGRWWVLTSQEGPSVLMSLVNLTSFSWDPRPPPQLWELHLNSAPCVLSCVGAVSVPSIVPAAGSMGALQTWVTVPCCSPVSWMNPRVTVQVACPPILSPEQTLDLCCR